jgi:serine/threonine protein kinase
MPHAWNVILVESENSSVRVLVDGCRPLDIRHESDPEYFCRYIPLKRFLLPSALVGDQLLSSSGIPSPVLFEEIGQGASGASVRRCKFGDLTAAAKVRQLEHVREGLSGKGPESSCLSELRILCSLRKHPCIVALYGHQFVSQSDSGPQLIIYMEHVKGGSLEGMIKKLAKEGKPFMSPRLACQVARDVACALGLLHSKGILHRDIKSSNVLVDMDSTQGPDGGPLVKLCDFDSAVPLSSSAAHTCYLAHRGVPPVNVCVGTPRWIAPEVLQAMYGRHPYGLEADVWSFGCLLAELLTLTVPYSGLNESEVHSRIQMGQRPHLSAELENLVAQAFPEKSSATEDMELLKVLVKLFYSCTNGSPSQRPTVKEIFTTLSEVSRPASIKVDSPFQEEASDAASNKQVTGPNVLKPLVEGTAAIEAGGEKECSHSESKSILEAKPA